MINKNDKLFKMACIGNSKGGNVFTKSAREMFEELGYKQNLQDDYIEYFIDCIDYPLGHYPFIIFDLKKQWWHSNLEGTKDEEDLAINQQCKELGWIVEVDNNV